MIRAGVFWGKRGRIAVLGWAAVVALVAALLLPGASRATAPATASTGSGTIIDGQARFQVLTPTLIRLEYAEDQQFEDRPTFNAVNRDFQPAPYTTEVVDGHRVIRTDKLTLRYRLGSGPFTKDNTEVRLKVGDEETVARPSFQSAGCRFGELCEAEDATLTGSAHRTPILHPGYTGVGFVSGYSRTGAATTVTVTDVPSAGDYALAVRYANQGGEASSTRTLTVRVDGASVGKIRFAPTGSWESWRVATLPVELDAGRHSVSLAREADDPGGVNVDSLAVTRPGDPYPERQARERTQLGGWLRSLDGVSQGLPPLEEGLLYREGWYLLNDSQTAVVGADGSVVSRPDHTGAYQDGYFFGYGRDYKQGLRDLRQLTGPAPLLPRWAFGVWYSAYKPYSESDHHQILAQFRKHETPVDTFLVDTEFKWPSKWNSWNWDPELYPNPDRFLDWAKDNGLHPLLNVHPSIASTDPKFPQTQETAGGALEEGNEGNGACPRRGLPCYLFDWGDPKQVEAYFDLHKPFERNDLRWWLDWCCDPSYSSKPGVTPNTWIHSLYAERTEKRGLRPFVFGRAGGSYAGYGSSGTFPSGPWAEHRYTVHSSHDARSNWAMLAAESEFTAAIGSIGMPYEAHVVGGFGGAVPDDLYARWVQMGAFQPLTWLHATPQTEKLPWRFGEVVRDSAIKFLRLREALVPYSYTLAREAHDTGIPMVRALWLEYPGEDEAYRHATQYLYGDQVLVAPVTTPGTGMVTTTVWLPPGTWTDYFTGRTYEGGRSIEVATDLSTMPVFVKAGGIVPQQPYMDHVGQKPVDPLILKVGAGADGSFTLYEDAGEGLAFRDGEYSLTPIRYLDSPDGDPEHAQGASLTIEPMSGDHRGRVDMRAYEVQFLAVDKPTRVTVGNDELAEPRGQVGWSYDEQTRTLTVRTAPRPVAGRTIVAHN